MRRVAIQVAISLAGCAMAHAQGRPIDWPSYNGDAQRTGWEKIDSRITKDNVKDFQLVLKRKLDNGQTGPYSLTPPVMIGLLISYRGFKELAFVAGSSGNMWAIDVDTDRMFWQKHFDTTSRIKASGVSGLCEGGVTTMPALIPPINFGVRPRPSLGGPGPGAPTASGADATPVRPTGRGLIAAGGFGAPRPAFAVSSDGKLHLMNTSTGDDVTPPMPFLPANAQGSSLTVVDRTVYTTATDCANGRSGVWALDLGGPEKKAAPVAIFALKGGSVSRHGGLAMGTDGTVFVQTGPGVLDPASNKWSNTLLALTPKKLKLANYFTAPDPGSGAKSTSNLNLTTPVVFTYKEKELVVSAGADGRLYLLDAKNPGGEDHKTPLCQTQPVASAGAGIWGGLSSWQDSDGTRWILAPVWGPVNPELNVPANNGTAPNGSIVAFKLEDRGGKLALTPAWVSRDIHSPEQPVITSGVVFALSAGDYGNSTPAVLYALDGATGKEMYSTGNQVTAPANLTGVTVANGRVFFTTTDSTLYGFGIYLER